MEWWRGSVHFYIQVSRTILILQTQIGMWSSRSMLWPIEPPQTRQQVLVHFIF